MGEGERSRLDAGGCRDSEGTKHRDKIQKAFLIKKLQTQTSISA